ncbi:MAG: hypothetical protein JW841_00510 [Deltaproteobacteria bacterium]|nr:hypothetical protein [Deltaproteobacteria bacterium]
MSCELKSESLGKLVKVLGEVLVAIEAGEVEKAKSLIKALMVGITLM